MSEHLGGKDGLDICHLSVVPGHNRVGEALVHHGNGLLLRKYNNCVLLYILVHK
jgi:hypothetical protein